MCTEFIGCALGCTIVLPLPFSLCIIIFLSNHPGDPEQPGNSCFFEIPGPQKSTSSAPVEFIRILRLMCCRHKHGKGWDGDKLCPLSFETFTPDCIQVKDNRGKKASTRERIEKMREVFKKAEEFFHNSG